MLDQLKNLKIFKKIKEGVNPRFNWLAFSGKNKLDKSTTDYLEAITGVDTSSDVVFESDMELEAAVRDQLKKEFPNIEKMKSYEPLVDAVVHNMKKQQLKSDETPDIE